MALATRERWIIAGGVAVAVALLLRKAQQVADSTEAALGNGGTIPVRLTGYWPFQSGLDAAARKMEGGHTDRRGNPLHTLEDFQSGNAPYVSVSGDDAIWPYGQRVVLDAWPDVVFRVVDTGAHFRGLTKVYRVAGREPLDICVDSSETVVPKLVNCTIVAGDAFSSREVNTSLLPG